MEEPDDAETFPEHDVNEPDEEEVNMESPLTPDAKVADKPASKDKKRRKTSQKGI